VLTYPRTDSRALPEDYLGTVKQTITMLAEEDLPGPLRELSAHARKALKEGYVKPTKRVFDNTKVSDHFAIIPTLQAPKSLTEIELKLYDMVVKRFLAVFYPSAEFMVTTRISTVKLAGGLHLFQTNGKVLVNAGWLAVYGKEAQDDDANLVAVAAGEMVRTESVDVLALKTKPPARYTEATLLSAMEGAGKLIEDEELRDAMKEKGLGTPATRAQTIEGLIAEKYMLRDGRELVPTAKAFQLMTLLRGLAIEDLTRPDLTGNWEYQLSEMEHGRLSRRPSWPRSRRWPNASSRRPRNTTATPSPATTPRWPRPAPTAAAWSRKTTAALAAPVPPAWTKAAVFPSPRSRPAAPSKRPRPKAFMRDKKIGPLEGFRSKAGWPFSAEIKLVRDDEINNWKLEFDFGEDARQAEGDGEPVDFSASQPGRLPQVPGPRLRTRQQLRVRTQRGRAP
jgi:DNA topoisomerase-3